MKTVIDVLTTRHSRVLPLRLFCSLRPNLDFKCIVAHLNKTPACHLPAVDRA